MMQYFGLILVLVKYKASSRWNETLT